MTLKLTLPCGAIVAGSVIPLIANCEAVLVMLSSDTEWRPVFVTTTVAGALEVFTFTEPKLIELEES